MYCRKCGNELPDDGKFCPKCGCEVEVNTNTKVKSTSNTKKTKRMLIVAICGLVVVLIIAFTGLHIFNENRYNDLIANAEQHLEDGDIDNAISCWEKAIEIKPNDSDEIKNELSYYKAIIEAEEAINEFDWSKAVEKLESAIEYKPDVAGNYISLATAYVEEWDLYKAEQVLKVGYEITQSSDLKNVSIWGPLSPVEIAYYMTDAIPFTRCEYLFSDNGINSYLYVAGSPIAGAKYYCDDAKVTRITLLDYDDYSYAGVFPQQFLGLPVFDSVLTYFDLDYNADGQISAVTYDGTTFATLEYEGENCKSITAQADFRKLFSAGDQLQFKYNNDEKISNIIYGEISVDFSYENNGSFHANISYDGTTYHFDSAGLCIGCSGMENGFEATSTNGRITSIEVSYDPNYSFGYKLSYTDGVLTFVEVTEGAGSALMFDSIEYFYDVVNGIKRLVRIEYTLTDHITTNETTMTYDDEGKLVRVYNEYNGYDMELSYIGNKLSSYVMTGRDYTKTTRVINYDAEGRFVGRK